MKQAVTTLSKVSDNADEINDDQEKKLDIMGNNQEDSEDSPMIIDSTNIPRKIH